MAVAADSKTCRVLQAAVVAVSLASIVLAVGLTQTAWFRVHAGWHLPAIKASFVMLPVTFLLFAFGVQWALRRRAVIAVAALVPLPVWFAALHLTRMETPPGGEAMLTNANLLVNDIWLALIFLPMQGIQPFGGA